LLANIYLHELDQYMESKYLNLSNHYREKRRRQGESNFLYIRYADDFVVLCNGTKAQALTMKEELKDVLNDMGLKLAPCGRTIRLARRTPWYHHYTQDIPPWA